MEINTTSVLSESQTTNNLALSAALLLALATSVEVSAQNNSVSDGQWSASSNWSGGVPRDNEVVNITTNKILDTDLKIDQNGRYVVTNGSILDENGGKKYKLEIEDSGYLEVNGNVTLEGDLKIEDNGELVVKGCDTLRVGGKLELKNDSKFVVNKCAVVFIDGDFKIKDDVLAQVDGNVVVGKKIELKDESIVSGGGYMESRGKIDTKDNSVLFGNNTGCNPGPCAAGSGSSLPIVLYNFDVAWKSSGLIKAEWETLSELNNDYFTVYYSADGNKFNELKRLSGAGTSVVKLKYRVEFENPVPEVERVYFKLRQTDFDGKFEEFNPVVVRRSSYSNNFESNSGELSVFPNPGDGQTLFIALRNLQPTTLKVSLFKISGERVLTKTVTTDEGNGALKIELLQGMSIAKGMYIVQVLSPSEKFEEKYIVH